MRPNIYRSWINQPSTLQEHHKYHGMFCIVVDYHDSPDFVQVFFTEGPVISTLIRRNALA